MCLNWADLAKNVLFMSYAAIRLLRRALVGHILVWERVHAPWSGIDAGSTESVAHASETGLITFTSFHVVKAALRRTYATSGIAWCSSLFKAKKKKE